MNGDTHDFEQSFNPKHETETHVGKTVRCVFLFKIDKRQIKLVFVDDAWKLDDVQMGTNLPLRMRCFKIPQILVLHTVYSYYTTTNI